MPTANHDGTTDGKYWDTRAETDHDFSSLLHGVIGVGSLKW